MTMRSMIGSGRRGILARSRKPRGCRLSSRSSCLSGRCSAAPTALRSSRSSVLEVGERLERLVDVPVGVLVEVVLDHEAPVFLDAAHQLVELEAHEAAFGAELDDAELELLGDPPHHLGALEHVDDVAHGDEVFHLDGAQAGGDLVEPVLVALERLDGLVGAGEQLRDRLEGVLLVAGVHRDDRHVLGDRDHRHVDRAGHPLGGAVPGAGLRGGDVRVRHQVHVGAGDAAGVAGQDDGAVHLRQLREALRAEGGVEQEPAGADVQHLGAVADHDQPAHLRLEDAVEPRTQRRAGGDDAERRHELGRSARRHRTMLPVVRCAPARAGQDARRCRGGRRCRRGAPLRRACGPGGPRCRGARAARSPARRRAGSRGAPPPPAGGRSGGPGAARRRARPRRTRRRRAGPGSPWCAEASASASARSAPGSIAVTPPAITVCTSCLANGMCTCCCSTATTRASRPLSRPCAERRGAGSDDGATSACTSTSSGRCPSSTGATTEPGVPGRRSARNSADGSGTLSSPASVISKRPSSSVAPKRCFTARRRRSAWWRSPSKERTVSTRCSSTAGRPASPPW